MKILNLSNILHNSESAFGSFKWNSLFNGNFFCEDDFRQQLHYNLVCNWRRLNIFALNRVGDNLSKQRNNIPRLECVSIFLKLVFFSLVCTLVGVRHCMQQECGVGNGEIFTSSLATRSTGRSLRSCPSVWCSASSP